MEIINIEDKQMFSRKLNEYFTNSIKLSYISDKYVIIITEEDKIYEFRRNDIKNALIALSDNEIKIKEIIEESYVKEISFKNVLEFVYDLEHNIALTSDGKIYRRNIDMIEKSQYSVYMHPLENLTKMIRTERICDKFNDTFILNGKFDKEFESVCEIGGGSFGKVYKVISKKHTYKEILFAIKRCVLKDDLKQEFWKELELSPVISKLNNERIVKYFDLWLEYSIKRGHKKLIFNIQMELCDKSLREAINEIKNDPKLYINEKLTKLGFYMSSNIFCDILEGVNYLHKKKPSIIHRDLNPSNIMLKIERYNKNVIKIVDLGLATFHKSLDESKTKDRGNVRYIAPEVRIGKHYTEKADIFSLGLILEELLYTDANRDNSKEGFDSILLQKYKILDELCNNMSFKKFQDRKSCEDILRDKDKWTLNEVEFNAKLEIESVMSSYSEQNSLIYKMMENSHIILQSIQLYLKNDKYSNDFRELTIISSGSFNTVHKVKYSFDSSNNENFALKKIKSNYQLDSHFNFIKLLQFSIQVKNIINERIVKFIDLWFEKEYVIENGMKLYNENMTFYILMELCDKTLNEIHHEILRDRHLYSNNSFTLSHCILRQLFVEILEGVDYLHKNNIIHRNLTPFNIFLKNGNIKIAHFYIAKQQYSIHWNTLDRWETLDKRNLIYIAPEVDETRSYDTKADIYSLGVVLRELIQVNARDITDLIKRMMDWNPKKRPDCKEILQEIKLWTLCESELNIKEEWNKICESYEDNSYIKTLIEAKMDLINQKSFLLQQIEQVKLAIKQKGENIAFVKNLIEFNDGKYSKSFTQESKLGEGIYGIIFKVKNRESGEFSAIKKISQQRNKYFFKNIDAIYNHNCILKNEYLVNCSLIWFERNLQINYGLKTWRKNYIFFIEMELCDKNLKQLKEEIDNDSKLYSNESLTRLGFNFLSQMFIDILCGVKYLHNNNIIHKHLKPDNILIKNCSIKIADFYFGKFQQHITDENNANNENIDYQIFSAPELFNCEYYNSKADIYSLGMIMKWLFNINYETNQELDDEIIENNSYRDFTKQKKIINELNKYENNLSISDELLQMKYKAVIKQIKVMMKNEKERPDCEIIIQQHKSWALNGSEFFLEYVDCYSANIYLWKKEFIKSQYFTNDTTLLFIERDLTEFYTSNNSTIHVVPEKGNRFRVHALIQGPVGTPYMYGFFYFIIQFPDNYPYRPPKVKLMTTGRETVDFHSKLNANGFVCLSILNTFSGTQWSPVMNLTSVLLSIQSLMNEEQEDKEHIIYKTISVAVLDMLEENFDSKSMQNPLKEIMIQYFKRFYYYYEEYVSDKVEKNLNNTIEDDLLNKYSLLLKRLLTLKKKYEITDTLNCSYETNFSENTTCYAIASSYCEESERIRKNRELELITFPF